MQTKLTLRLDDSLIQRAKTHAEARGTSLSRLVADYFSLLTLDNGEVTERIATPEAAPVTASLWGILEGAPVDEGEYRRHLEEKYL